MFLPDGEHHEIGLLLAYYIAKDLGWRVYYLGQNVPVQNINQVVEEINPTAMLTMLIASTRQNFVTQLDGILAQSKIPLFVSGNPKIFENSVNENLI
ncbi:cobalamin B12-binding domain-containing protein, partial [Desulfosarcina sp.]|nr:cobalamin B12-binding domain-containing protein [Desulfosarcina sp.]